MLDFIRNKNSFIDMKTVFNEDFDPFLFDMDGNYDKTANLYKTEEEIKQEENNIQFKS